MGPCGVGVEGLTLDGNRGGRSGVEGNSDRLRNCPPTAEVYAPVVHQRTKL